MVSKMLIALCVVLAVAVAVPAPGGAGAWGPPGGWGPAAYGWGPAAGGAAAGPGAVGGGGAWVPPWLAAAPWFPQWSTCTTIGTTCLDCNTKQICTKVGGLQRACTDPTLPYCNAGACSATPTLECAPISAVPATTA